MLTDERIDEIKEKHTYSTKDFDAHRFAREIEAEVLQAQEPVGWGFELATVYDQKHDEYGGWSKRLSDTKPNAGRGMRNLVALSPTIPEGMTQGIEAVAKMLDKKADDYAAQYGYDDMGSLSFGSGDRAEAKREFHTYLIETAESVRAMLAAAQGERNAD